MATTTKSIGSGSNGAWDLIAFSSDDLTVDLFSVDLSNTSTLGTVTSAYLDDQQEALLQDIALELIAFYGRTTLLGSAALTQQMLRKVAGLVSMDDQVISATAVIAGTTATLRAAPGGVSRLFGLYVPNAAGTGVFTGDGITGGNASGGPPSGPAGGVLGYTGSTYPNPNGLASIADQIPVRGPKTGNIVSLVLDSTTTIGNAGDSFTIAAATGGAGTGIQASGPGGNITLTAGVAGIAGGAGTGAAGAVFVNAGSGSLTGGSGGNVTVSAGSSGGVNPGGAATIASGAGSDATGPFAGQSGGVLQLAAGQGGAGSVASFAGTGGTTFLSAGSAGAANGGDGGAGGNIVIEGGNGTGLGTAGSVTINAGTGATSGVVSLNAGIGSPNTAVTSIGDGSKPGQRVLISARFGNPPQTGILNTTPYDLTPTAAFCAFTASAPTVLRSIANGFDGQEITFLNLDAADTITFQRTDGYKLGAATRVLGNGGSITLRYQGGSWYEITFLASAT